MFKEAPKTLCALPWISLETSPGGNVRPCCLYTDFITDKNGNKYDLKEHTLEEVYNSDYMKKLRTDFRSGDKPSPCSQCWSEEDAGRDSKRINVHRQLVNRELHDEVNYASDSPDQLWFIDLKLGNICNLKCRICGYWSSSKWAQEQIELDKEYNSTSNAYQFLKDGNWPRESNLFWKHFEELLPNIKSLEISGGEPFLIQEQFNVLQRAVDLGYAKNIRVHYNTNGTQYPKEAIELWKQFELVEIAFSIDNTKEQFEYERYGASWGEVNSNLMRFAQLRDHYSNIELHLCTTVNVFNIGNLPEVYSWATTKIQFDFYYFNLLYNPEEFSICNMTERAKNFSRAILHNNRVDDFTKDEYEKIIKFMYSSTDTDGSAFCKRVDISDKFRNQDILDTHYTMARIMGVSRMKRYTRQP